MNIRNLLWILPFYVHQLLAAQAVLYVSPNGQDTNSGSETYPLASLNGARDAIRKHKKSGQHQSYTVIIKDGYYEMKEAFSLEAQDSGTKDYPIVYRAEEGAKPVFSGGKRMPGLKENEEGIWQVKVSGGGANDWRFDQLYVNGKRATLARTPNDGFFTIDTVKQTILKQGTGRVAESAEQRIYLTSKAFHALMNVKAEEVGSLRFRAYHKWDFTLRLVDDMLRDSSGIVTSGRGMKPWNPLKKGRRIVFENFAAALDEPGEWFLDSDGILSYMPRQGETPDHTTMLAPILEQLVTIKGDLEANRYVSYVTLAGLSFTNCHYKIPAAGSEPTQAAAHINAAIYTEGVKHLEISNCEVYNIGQHAIWLGPGSSYCRVQKNHLHELGGGGVYLGAFQAGEAQNHCHHIRVDNNIIQHGGQVFPTSVGIWVGHSSDNLVTHNDIGDFYYTGISVGWVWGYKPSTAKRNTISFNHIHHIGWDLLSDMAGIYTLGESEGTSVLGNKVHHIHAYSYGGWGLYADEGSTGITFENNLAYNTKTGGFQQNYGKENLVKNNILAFAHRYQMQCTVPEKHQSFTFVNNIIFFKEGMVAKGAWDRVNARIDHNLYWNVAGGKYDFNGSDFQAWKALGFDEHSMKADPGFRKAGQYDFRLRSQKITEKIGFIPFDDMLAGVYGDRDWQQKAVLSKALQDEFDQVVAENLRQNIKR